MGILALLYEILAFEVLTEFILSLLYLAEAQLDFIESLFTFPLKRNFLSLIFFLDLMKWEIFSQIQLRCQSCFVSALLCRLLGWVGTDNTNTALAQGRTRIQISGKTKCLFYF